MHQQHTRAGAQEGAKGRTTKPSRCRSGRLLISTLDTKRSGSNHRTFGGRTSGWSGQKRNNERRTAKRAQTCARVCVVDRSIERFTHLVDVSLGGGRVYTATPPGVGQKLAMRFRLRTDGEEVLAMGQVVWRSVGFRGRGGVIGIVFSSVSSVGEIVRFLNEG